MRIKKTETTTQYPLFSHAPKTLRIAYVETGGYSLMFTQWDGEKDWYCDMMVKTSNCFPVFAHGEGSRSCQKRVAKPDMAQAIEDAFKTDKLL